MTLAGTVTSGTGTLTVTVQDSALIGGQEVVNYAVQSTDTTLALMASGLSAAIASDSSLQAIGVNATATGAVVSIRSLSANATAYTTATSGGATETLGLGLNRSLENITIGGTITSGNVVKVNVYDASFGTNPQVVSYTVTGGDTTTTVAQHLASGFASLGSNGYFSATNHGPVITVTSTSPNVVRYTNGSVSVTETESIGPVLSGNQTILIGGSKTTADQLKVNVYDIGLASNPETVTYTVASGDTLTTIATNLASAIASDTNLTNIGVTAAASGTVVTISSSSVNATSYVPAVASTVTETMTMGLPANGTSTAVIGGSVSHTANDKVTVNVYDNALVEAGFTSPESVTYTVQTGDTTTAAVASGLAAAIAADTKLSGIGVAAASPSNSSVVNITSNSVRATTYSVSAATGATETISVSSAAGVLQSAYNNVNELTNINSGGPVLFQGTSNQPLVSASIATSAVATSISSSSYSESVSGADTETITLGQYVNGTQTATIGGTATTGDQLIVSVSNTALSGGVESATYTVPSGSPSTTTMASRFRR